MSQDLTKKNTAQIMYDRLINHPEFISLDPLPQVFWEVAKR